MGGALVPSISAIVLSLARRTCQHRRSLSQDKCWFCCTSGAPWLQRFDSPSHHGVARERARRRTRPDSSDAFIVFCSLAVQRRSSTAAAPPPCQIVCRVNRETEIIQEKGKFPPLHPPPAYPPLVLYLWPKCLGIKSYYFLVNKPVSGRNYTQLGVRSFSVRGLDPFI